MNSETPSFIIVQDRDLPIMANLYNVFIGPQNAYPQCAKKKLPCYDLTCYTCFMMSFASNPKSNYWSATNAVAPRFMNKGSNKKIFIVCPDCYHLLEKSPSQISQGYGCKYCTRRGSNPQVSAL